MQWKGDRSQFVGNSVKQNETVMSPILCLVSGLQVHLHSSDIDKSKSIFPPLTLTAWFYTFWSHISHVFINSSETLCHMPPSQALVVHFHGILRWNSWRQPSERGHTMVGLSNQKTTHLTIFIVSFSRTLYNLMRSPSWSRMMKKTRESVQWIGLINSLIQQRSPPSPKPGGLLNDKN